MHSSFHLPLLGGVSDIITPSSTVPHLSSMLSVFPPALSFALETEMATVTKVMFHF